MKRIKRLLKNIWYDLRFGIKSKFSPCCIGWFFIRNYLLNIHIKPNSKLSNIESKHSERLHANHILCPLHWLRSKPVEYEVCESCDWLQSKGSNKCGWCKKSKLRPYMWRVDPTLFSVSKARWESESNI